MNIFENPTKKAVEKCDLEQFVQVAYDKSGLINRYKMPNNFVEHDYMSTKNIRKHNG